MAESDFVYVKPDVARAYAHALLKAHEFSDAHAKTAAHCLIRADMRGVDTHGILRLPIYLDRIRKGLINATPDLRPKRVTPAVASLDGQNGLGFVVATRAMEEAIAIAREMGVGIVSVHHGIHFGMAANYVLQAVEADFAALVITNASPAMPPWGGRKALLGTGPLASGMPGGKHGPFVLDMSPTVAARGKVRLAAKRGEKIPEGYALDADGKPTTDPLKALAGIMLPLGGPKGSGLAVMADVFGGVLSGSAFAGMVGDQYKDYDRPQNVGHFFLALKPDLFVTRAELANRMDMLVERLKAVPKAEGFNEILMPGEPESRKEAARKLTGIPYGKNEIDDLQTEGARAGLPKLEVSDKPFA